MPSLDERGYPASCSWERESPRGPGLGRRRERRVRGAVRQQTHSCDENVSARITPAQEACGRSYCNEVDNPLRDKRSPASIRPRVRIAG